MIRAVCAIGVLLAIAVFVQRYPVLDEARLVHARLMLERSPQLALAGTDLEKLDEAIERLERVRSRLAERQSSARDRAVVMSALYPIEWLEARRTLEERRRAFLASGDAMDLIRYDRALREALAAYRRDFRRISMAFETVVPEDASPYATAQYLMTKDSVRASLDELARNLEKEVSTYEMRRGCPSGDVERCGGLKEFRPAQDTALTKEELRRATLVQDLFSEAYDADAFRNQIVIAMDSASCAEGMPGNRLFSLFETGDATIPTHVGDLRLSRSSEHTDIPFYRYFSGRGVEFVPAPIFAYYACPTMANDVSRMLAVRAVAEFAGEMPVGNYVTDGAVSALEQKPPVVSEADALRYVAAIAAYINDLPEAMRPDAHDLVLAATDRSADFDAIVDYIAFIEESALHAMERGVSRPLDAAALLYIRSGAHALFFTGRSVATFEPSGMPVSEQPFTYYSLLRNVADADIVAGIRAFKEVYSPVDTE